MAETNEKILTQTIEKIKKSMKANRISGFYLFAIDWHPTHEELLRIPSQTTTYNVGRTLM